LRDSADSELARAKITASQIGDSIRTNLASLDELAADYLFLFNDIQQLVLKANDDLVALIKVRISEHQKAEEQKAEAQREQIRQQELTRNEISEREGIALATLKAIASKHAIKFQIRQKIGTAPNRAPPDVEARLVAEIKNCIAGGMNRSQCCKALAVSYNMLNRIVRDNGIDFPKLKPAFR
jgi:hypothetical protein